MFWLSYAYITIEKYQYGVSKTFEIANQLIIQYMHVILKNKKAFRDDFQCDEMTANEIQLLEEFQKKMSHLNKARYLSQRIINCQNTESLIELKESGIFDFAESVLTDATHSFDVKTMRDLLSQNKCTPGNFSKIFSSICVDRESCQYFF